MRGTVFGPAVVLVVVVSLHADDAKDSDPVKGRLKSADFDRGIVTLTVGEKDREFQINRDTRFLDKDGVMTEFNINTPTLPNLFREWARSKDIPPFTITSKLKHGRNVAISVKLPLVIEGRREQKNRAFQKSLLGKPLPTFKMTDTLGRVVTNAHLQGKVALIDFWATDCEPCLKVSRIMQVLHDRYAHKGLIVVGASIETDEEDKALKEKLNTYIKKEGYTYSMLFDADELAAACGIPGIPTMLIVDRKGVIRRARAGLWDGEELQSEFDEAIKSLLDEK
jgi:thiol-disulfide isomerase/thioredoxin